MKLVPALLCVLALSACGGGMSGVYASPDGQASLEFRANRRVYVTFVQSTFAGEYELDGDRVIIEGPGGSQVCKLAGDRLEGFGTTFTKEQ